MKYSAYTTLFLLILVATGLIVTGAPPVDAHASLHRYVRKYKKIKASEQQMQRLQKYNHLIEYFSSFSFFEPRHKVNPDFMRALILAESDGDPMARSSMDARGLTQIIYSTGRQAARELLKKNISFRHVSRRTLQNLRPGDLYSPEVNILLACYLIAKYNYTFQGKLDLVVSAWNAGEHSIVGNQPAQFRETLNHIGKVNGYFIYFLKQKQHTRRYVVRSYR